MNSDLLRTELEADIRFLNNVNRSFGALKALAERYLDALTVLPNKYTTEEIITSEDALIVAKLTYNRAIEECALVMMKQKAINNES